MKPVAGYPNTHNLIQFKHTNVISTNIDQILSNTTHSGASAMLYFFEGNDAIIKILIKGRSPTMRHVSRTHGVALDWLFDRINLDPKKFKSVTFTPNTKSQTFSQKGISRLMSGIIFFICSMLATSAPLAASRISA